MQNSRNSSDGFTTVQRRSDTPKAAWTCKTCVGGGGGPWRNNGSLGTCGKCKVAKGACFGAKVGDACPTVRLAGYRGGSNKQAEGCRRGGTDVGTGADVTELQKQVKLLQSQLAQAQTGQPADATPTIDTAKAEEGSAAQPEQAKRLQGLVDEVCTEIKKYKDVPGELCLPDGGPTIQQHLVALALRKEQLLAQKNGTLPMRDQVAKLKRQVEFDRKSRERLGTEKEGIDKQIQSLLEKQEDATKKYQAADQKLSVGMAALAQLEVKLKAEAPPAGGKPAVDPTDIQWVLAALGNVTVQQAMVQAGLSEAEHAKTQSVMGKLQAVVAATTAPNPEPAIEVVDPQGPVAEAVEEEEQPEDVLFESMDLDGDSLQDMAKGLKRREGEDDAELEARRCKVIASGKAYIHKGSAKCKVKKTATKGGDK